MPEKTALLTGKLTDRRKTIIKIIEKAAQEYNKHSVWNDWIYMAASAISQPIDFRQNREEEYLRRISAYDKETQKIFPELFVELILAFEDERFGDILGEIYTSLNMTNEKAGQFFTPYNVCKMMAAMQISKEHLPVEIERKGYISVNDPCCGGGALLIAFADQCMECDVNYQQSVLFVAQDIDPAVALMCYVQMSLLGMPGYVIIGNIFTCQTPETSSIWYTPMYFLQGFQYRTQREISEKTGTEIIENEIIEPVEQQKIIIPEAKADVVSHETESGQFTFDFAS